MNNNADNFFGDRHLMLLFDAIRDGDLNMTRQFLRMMTPQAVKKLDPDTGKSALHLAAMAGNMDVVKELIEFLPNDDFLEVQGICDGHTALVDAIYYGIKDIVEYMVGRNKRILEIHSNGGLLPVALAFVWGYKEIGQFLYEETPHEALSSQEGTISGATILTTTIRSLGEFGK
ncbi:Transmembrane protein [Parasponia andersonii]|uniref:Transmembrane protein n=1 Tax=Parasponia andersonii TaxID=3476 RepID=A0A2P5DAH7_PARAD|nr:Transmembrane protein [Parasponia andersonii]